MLKRLFGVLALLVVLVAGALAMPAAAADSGGHGELPPLEEVGSQSDVARQFFPEEAEEQPFTEALVYPLLAVAIIAILVTGFLYLKWQPSFGQEGSRRR
jgi:hypothetical protein